jgi:hypothetical protein
VFFYRDKKVVGVFVRFSCASRIRRHGCQVDGTVLRQYNGLEEPVYPPLPGSTVTWLGRDPARRRHLDHYWTIAAFGSGLFTLASVPSETL